MAAMSSGPNVGFTRLEVSRKLPKWNLVDNCVEGQESVKAQGETYLPKPDGNLDPVKNASNYEKYLTRAVFFPSTSRTLDGLVGQVFAKNINTDLPPSLANLKNDVDGSGTTLEQQGKQTLETVIKKGRAGLLADFPTLETGTVVTRADIESGRVRPRVILFQPEEIINWREMTIGGETQLSLLVLLETKDISSDKFEVEIAPRWRVYELGESGVEVSIWRLKSEIEDDFPFPAYAQQKFQDDSTDYEMEVEPAFVFGSDGLPLQEIPFSFVGSLNNDSTVDEPPLYPLASLNIAHFRNSADYEQSLFIAGQPTPVFTGLTDQWVTDHIKGQVMLGSQNAVSLPPGSSAELLQASANSMPMEGMKHKEELMKAIGAKLIEPGVANGTATEAEIREAGETSILSSVAKNVSAAYEMAFRFCSYFGEPVEPENILIQLNSDFSMLGLSAGERQEIMVAWQGGILTWAEVREVYRRKGIATTPDDEARAAIDSDTLAFESAPPIEVA